MFGRIVNSRQSKATIMSIPNSNVLPNVLPKDRRVLGMHVTSIHVTLSYEFLYSRGGENILQHMLNKLPLSLFSTRVKLTYFTTCVQKLVHRYSKKFACREETHTHTHLSRLHFNLLEPHLLFYFCFALWMPSPGARVWAIDTLHLFE
jgi:hypothetical protein